MSKWIPVSERLPENKVWVLIAGHEFGDPSKPRLFQVAMRNGTTFFNNGAECLEEDECWNPTHWMPLPEPPSPDA